jgi:thiamine monophosphate kinase
MIEGSEKDFLKRLHLLLGSGGAANWRDDCIVRPVGDTNLVYSIDRPEMIRHTDDRTADLRYFGRWSAALTASDVIAEGARPIGVAFDVGRDVFATADEFLLWAEGVQDVCRVYGMKYEGGNLGTGSAVVGVAYGFTQHPIRRRGSVEGDFLLVTYPLGSGWAKRLLSSQGKIHERKVFSELVTHQDEPWINIDVFEQIWNERLVNAGMDLTDGVIEFGFEIWEQDGLGVLFSEPDSISPCIREAAEILEVPAFSLLLEPGYDAPLNHAWTVSPKNLNRVLELLGKNGIRSTVIGRTTGERGVEIQIGDRRVAAPRYWDDVFEHRGSVERWRSEILTRFQTS